MPVALVSLNEMRDRQLADYRLQHVGTIFQSFNLIPTLSAQDNVAYKPRQLQLGFRATF